MKKKAYLAFLLALTLIAAGCSIQDNSSAAANGSISSDTGNSAVSGGGTSESPAVTDASEMFSDRDYEVGYDEGASAMIQLDGDSAACSSDAVQISGSTVTITDEGTYILSGTLDDGMVIVNTDKSDKVQLVLDNVTIHSETCAPIYILQSDKVFVTTIAGSANTLSNGGMFTAIDENNIDAVIFSKEDVTLNGSVTVNGGTFEAASGDDAFHADDTLTVTAGTINITKSYEGLEGSHVNVSGGDITLTASDDGLNAAGGTDSSGSTGGRDGMFGPGTSFSDGSVTISGGTLKITASGDGIDANGTLDITGGYTIVSGPTQGDTATLDYDVSGTISGGTFIGTGASGGMAQTFSDSGQGVISVNAGSQSAGTQIQLSDSQGNTIITYTPELDFALVILSSPDIISGETYTLTAGVSSGEFTAS